MRIPFPDSRMLATATRNKEPEGVSTVIGQSPAGSSPDGEIDDGELCHAKLPISGEISGTEEPLLVSNQACPSRKPFHPQEANAIEAQKGKRYEAQDPQKERFAATIVLEFDAQRAWSRWLQPHQA